MTLAPARPETAAISNKPTAARGVRTALADDLRAIVQVSTDLDSHGVAALEDVIAEHCARGRRYLRISIAGVRRLDPALITLLERTHYRMLAQRGTCIITGAGPAAMRTLRELHLDDVLLIVEAFATERSGAHDVAVV